MPNGTIANATNLIDSGWSTTTTTYGFYLDVADLPSVYTGRKVDHPYTPGPPAGPNPANPLYTDVFLTTTNTERDYIRDIFTIVQNLTDQTLTETNDATTSNIGIGGVDVRPLGAGGNYIAGWGSYPTWPDLTGDFWLAQDGREGAAGNFFYLTAAHEMMHTLGLKDAAAASLGTENSTRFTIMSTSVDSQLGQFGYELQLYDIAALHYLYGNDGGYNSGNTSYANFRQNPPGTTSAQDRIFAIWDGGGTDTIDASAYNAGAFIDLRPGYFSTIGAAADATISGGLITSVGRGNISIAFGAYIENAIGTDDHDGIVGNSLSNHLSGGDGDDVIYGDGATAPGALAGAGDYRVINKGILSTSSVNPANQQDTLDGGAGADALTGGVGADSLTGGNENDTLTGGQGADTLSGGQGDDSLSGGAGGDLLLGDEGADTVNGVEGGDSVLGGEGDDLFRFDAASGDGDLDGGAGHDVLSFAQATAGVAVSITDGVVEFGDVSIASAESVVGTAYQDTFTFTGDAPWIEIEPEVWVPSGVVEIRPGGGNDIIDALGSEDGITIIVGANDGVDSIARQNFEGTWIWDASIRLVDGLTKSDLTLIFNQTSSEDIYDDSMIRVGESKSGWFSASVNGGNTVIIVGKGAWSDYDSGSGYPDTWGLYSTINIADSNGNLIEWVEGDFL